jgi:hypothetical protein
LYARFSGHVPPQDKELSSMDVSRIVVKATGMIVEVDCTGFALDSDGILERFLELTPVIQQVLCADETWLRLSDEKIVSLVRAKLAQDLVYQASLEQARLAAAAAHSLVSGEDSIVGARFPEFMGFEVPLDL